MTPWSIIMEEDNKVNNVDTTTFAQPVPEKTELEKLQERIANFKVQITPTVAQLAQVLMNQALQNPTKPEDLDGYIQVRNELIEGLTSYQEQLTSAQRRMAQLTEEHNILKAQELARKEADLIAARDGERKRRKDAEEKARQLEAVLASHGVHIDLDGDGKVGLNVGEEKENLTAEQQVTLKKLLDESKAAVTTSPAFAKARSLNPVPQSETTGVITHDPELQAKIDATKEAFESAGPDVPTIELPVPDTAKGTTEFEQEVEEVAKTSPDDLEEVGFDANGSPTIESPINNKPVISDTNSPSIIEEELEKEAEKRMDIIGQNGNDGLHYDQVEQTPNVRIVAEEDIAEFEEKVNGVSEDDFSVPPPAEEDEVVEVSIPTESELKGMTKSKIQQEANSLGFANVSTKSSKSKMISDFIESTEQFIADLQDSGEFVSARDEDDDEATDSSDDRDGGYFK